MSNGKKYNFSSVGEDLTESILYAENVISEVPISIATPMRISNKSNEFFSMHSDFAGQIRDNFKNMIATNHGERLVLSDFGANLKNLLFDIGNEFTDQKAIRQISATTRKYMPFIELSTFEASKSQDDFNGEFAKIRIVYAIPSINLNNQVLDIILPVR
jgi:phage baseplate assembly protein W